MQLPTYDILPAAVGGPIIITVSMLTPQVGSCRVFRWASAQEKTEIMNPAGNSLPWKYTLPNDPATYSGNTIDCMIEVIEPAPTPGGTYKVRLEISQNGSNTPETFSAAIGADPARPRLAITLK